MGKVASGAPIVISRALEMFIASLTKQSCEVAEKAGSRTLSAGHLYVPPLPCTPSICVAMEKFFTSYTFVCVCDGTPPPFSWLNARLRCCTGSYCGWLWYTHVSTSRDRKVCIEGNPQFDYLKTFVADVPLPSVSVSMGGGALLLHIFLPCGRSSGCAGGHRLAKYGLFVHDFARNNLLTRNADCTAMGTWGWPPAT